MVKYLKANSSNSTELTWEERHPFSFRFNKEVLEKLQKAIKEAEDKKKTSSDSK
jgi:hypothetical protein